MSLIAATHLELSGGQRPRTKCWREGQFFYFEKFVLDDKTDVLPNFQINTHFHTFRYLIFFGTISQLIGQFNSQIYQGGQCILLNRPS